MVMLPPPAFEATYRTFSFPTGTITGDGKLTFTPDDLAHALFTTGRAPADWSLYGVASKYEWLHRVSLIPAYVRRTYRGELMRSRLALELDRSELVGLSYALGQAITAVFCRLELSVTHLLHVDRYANHFGLQFSTRKRADLIGCAPDGWVVAEAKGRSRSMEASLRGKLVAQKRSITSISGTPPWLALGCVASFPIRGAGLEVDVFDPDEDEFEAIDVPIDLDRYMLAYYSPFVLALNQGIIQRNAELNAQMVLGTQFPGLGLSIGLLRTIYERVLLAVNGELAGLSADIQAILGVPTVSELGLLPDGTYVVTAWAEAVATQDWSESL